MTYFPVHMYQNMNKRESLLVVIQEKNKLKIQSVLEHLCGDGSKLEIYQKNQTNEMIISGKCVEGLSTCQTSIKKKCKTVHQQTKCSLFSCS